MLTGELIQRVQSLYSKGVQSDENRLTPRHIYNKLLSVRGAILLQQSKKRQKISEWSYQLIPCIEVIDVPLTECPCVPSNNCVVKRTKYPLPKPITSLMGHNIDWILSLDGTIRFDESSRREMLHVKGNRYTSTDYRYIIERGYAYLYGRNIPKVVQAKMLCEDPMEAETFKNTCITPNLCTNPMDLVFPIETGFVDLLIETCVKELVDSFRQQKEDIKNNSVSE